MRRLSYILPVMLGISALASCLPDAGNPGGGDMGSVTLPLQTAAPNGNVYQLRNAFFDISGPTMTTRATPATADPSAVLSATLLAGSYTVTLRPGWTLWRMTPGPAQAVASTLTSRNPLPFTIAGGGQTNVGFAFLASGDPIDFTTGALNIGISVTVDAGTSDGGPLPPQNLEVLLTIEGETTGASPKPGSVTSTPIGINCAVLGTGPNGPSCSANFAGGSIVTLTAAPTSAVLVAGWRGECGGTQSTTMVSMTEERDCTVVFAPPPFPPGGRTGTVGLAVAVGGSVTSIPAGLGCGAGGSCSAQFLVNSIVTLTATPNPGFVFTGWNDDCSGTQPSTFLVSSSLGHTCGANFAAAAP